jgi:hypothetical protein
LLRLSTIFTGLAAGLILMLLLALSAAAEGRRWIADSGDDVATLIYGTPESDDMVLSFTCERASKTLTIWFAPQPVPVKPPDSLPLTLSSEAGRLQLTAVGSHSDLDDSYSLQVQTPLTPELEQLLVGAHKLSVKVENRATDMAIDDVALKGAEELVEACRR